jgi:hypothetical protein
MKKTTFRINLCEGSNSLCETLALLAAHSNGGKSKLSLSQLKTVADGKIIEYPYNNENTKAELIGNNLLHIDRKVGDEIRTVCSIEEIEVFEIATPVFEEKPYLHEQTNWD